ncbi:MAG: metallophosphoesterase [Desulfuromonadales bacterium]
MTRIGILSDTHLDDLRKGLTLLDDLYRNQFRDVSLILHAGDVVNPDIFMAFEGIPVYAVRGNMDPYVEGIPLRRIVTVDGYRIGLIHGWGPPEGLESRILREFGRQRLDALVYGHSHQPANHVMDGLLLFNPGSATEKRRAEYCSIGILEVSDAISGQIINLD